MAENSKPYPITDEVWMVPCKISKNKKDYLPKARPFPKSKIKSKSKKSKIWSKEEDEIILDVILRQKSKNWTSLAKEINLKVHHGVPVKIGKQCRERWANHLDPKLIKDNWTEEEDQKILAKYNQCGNKWSEIAKCIEGRNENQVKNRCKSLLSRQKKEKSEYPISLSYLSSQETFKVGKDQLNMKFLSRSTQENNSLSEGFQATIPFNPEMSCSFSDIPIPPLSLNSVFCSSTSTLNSDLNGSTSFQMEMSLLLLENYNKSFQGIGECAEMERYNKFFADGNTIIKKDIDFSTALTNFFTSPIGITQNNHSIVQNSIKDEFEMGMQMFMGGPNTTYNLPTQGIQQNTQNWIEKDQ